MKNMLILMMTMEQMWMRAVHGEENVEEDDAVQDHAMEEEDD